MRKPVALSCYLFLVLALPAIGSTQPTETEQDTIEALKRQMEALRTQLDALQARLEALEAEQRAAPTPATTPALNPDISVISDFLAVGGPRTASMPARSGGDDAGETLRSLALREVELGFQAPVDPFGRADIFLSFGPEEIEVEEAYLTVFNPRVLGLPSELRPRVGKFRSRIARVNLTHQPELAQVDYPAVVRHFLGSEGFSQPGAEVSWLLPIERPFTELTTAVFGGSSESVFGADTNYLAALRAFWELSESSDLELAFSGAHGSLGLLGDRTLLGGSLTFRWKPLQAGTYRSFWWQNEFLTVANAGDLSRRPKGFYSFAQYQLARQWYLGARWDWTDIPGALGDRDTGVSALLTYFPSEFTRYRLQAGALHDPELGRLLRVLFQATFSLGPHRPEPY